MGEWLRNQRGGTMVILSVVLTALLLFAGLVLDLGRAHLLRAQLQTAVDAGALAGAMEVTPTAADPLPASEARCRAAVRQAVQVNATWPEGRRGTVMESLEVEIDRRSITVKVSATLRLPTHFLRLIGVKQLRLSRSATATPVRRAGILGDGTGERWGSKLVD
ncbi:MAG: pilus assembly protein TadG-related protein [Bacillota bacterium]